MGKPIFGKPVPELTSDKSLPAPPFDWRISEECLKRIEVIERSMRGWRLW